MQDSAIRPVLSAPVQPPSIDVNAPVIDSAASLVR